MVSIWRHDPAVSSSALLILISFSPLSVKTQLWWMMLAGVCLLTNLFSIPRLVF